MRIDAMVDTRLNTRRLARALLLGVIIPISLALLADLAMGTLPLVTIIAIVIFLPVGAIWLGRALVEEFDRVIDEVAPEIDAPETAEEPAESNMQERHEQV